MREAEDDFAVLQGWLTPISLRDVSNRLFQHIAGSSHT